MSQTKKNWTDDDLIAELEAMDTQIVHGSDIFGQAARRLRELGAARKTWTTSQIEAAAAAIANARGGRRGGPPVSNILDLLRSVNPKLLDEVLEDATAALNAVI